MRRGQLLVQLDDTLQRAELSQAQAQLSIARANLKRNEELLAQNFVAARVVDESRAALQVDGVTRHGPGAVSRLVPPDDEVHAMHNPTGRDTLEIHVYGRDLYGLARKTWAPDGRVTPLVSPKYLNC